jgi:hypothetical protein
MIRVIYIFEKINACASSVLSELSSMVITVSFYLDDKKYDQTFLSLLKKVLCPQRTLRQESIQ